MSLYNIDSQYYFCLILETWLLSYHNTYYIIITLYTGLGKILNKGFLMYFIGRKDTRYIYYNNKNYC